MQTVLKTQPSMKDRGKRFWEKAAAYVDYLAAVLVACLHHAKPGFAISSCFG